MTARSTGIALAVWAVIGTAAQAAEAAAPAGGSSAGLASIDWAIIGAYFLALFGITWYSVLKNKDTADDYFLAGRSLGWFIVAASIFSSNIGSEHLVGLAGSGCTDGVAMAHYELHAWCLLVLAWVFVPFYMRSMVYTMPEFLEKRFSPTARWVLSIISLVAYVVTKLAVGIFAGGVVFAVLLPEMQHRPGLHGSRRLLDRLGRRGRAHRALHGDRRPARRGLHRHAPDDHLHRRLGDGHRVRADRSLGGWDVLYQECGSEMFNLWKPLVPAGVEGTWAPVERPARRWPGTSTTISPGWGCSSAPRSSACGTGAPTSTSCSGPWRPRTRRSPGAGASPPPS